MAREREERPGEREPREERRGEREPREEDVERERPPREREVVRERRVTGTGTDEAAHPPAVDETTSAGRRDALIWRVVQAVDYLFFLLYSLFLIRFVLAMMGSSESAGFVRFMQSVTEPFYAPFEGLAPRPALDRGYLDFPLVVALIAYIFLHLAVRGLIRVIVGPRPPA